MTALFVLVMAFCVLASDVPPESLFVSLYWTPNKGTAGYTMGYSRTGSDLLAAQIAVNNGGMDNYGWDGVYIIAGAPLISSTDPNFVRQAYHAVGYAEGYSTTKRIQENWYNLDVQEIRANFTNETRAWVSEHLAYMYNKTKENSADPYWMQVGHFLAQVEGLTDGYRDGNVFGYDPLDFDDIFMINFIFEIWDVEEATGEAPPELLKGKRFIQSHCSALIKDVQSNLLVAHNTWSTLETMLRQSKTYIYGNLGYTMSGYPGTIHSGDDFYVLNNRLVILETTNANFNEDNFVFVVPQSVSEFIRVLVAHHLAGVSGSAWTETFCLQNSGTYNNQFMVVDMSKYFPGTGVGPNTLWVVEQMPGLCVREDKSDVLSNTSYWASYNRPYFASVYNYSGFAKMNQTYGPYFSYSNNYRALIFSREQAAVLSVDSMEKVIRFNDYLHDAFSVPPNCTNCWPQQNPGLSIANRGDLIPTNASYGIYDFIYQQENEAAIDAKIVSWTNVDAMNPRIAAGPTFGGFSNITKFQFSTTTVPNVRHRGIPDIYGFNFMDSLAVFANAPLPVPDFKPGEKVLLTATVDSATFNETTFKENVLNFVDLNAQAQLFVQFQSNLEGNSIVIESVQRVGVNSTVTFYFAGPNSTVFSNILTHATPSQLASIGILGLTYRVEQPATPEEQRNLYWVAGVVIAGVAVAIFVAFLIFRAKHRSGAEGDYQQMESKV